MDPILVSSPCWEHVKLMAYHTIAMTSFDHGLVLMTIGLTSTDRETFIKATHPAEKWTVLQERAAARDAHHILAGQDTPMDPVSRADAVRKAAKALIGHCQWEAGVCGYLSLQGSEECIPRLNLVPKSGNAVAQISQHGP